ncbi:hypothetical protein BGZ92_010466, partial [Podila epicladia]
MSDNAVTQVHEFVVDRVIKKSRQVFEEMGFSETALEALRKGWKDKIGLTRQTSSQSSMQTDSSSSSSSESTTSQTADHGTMHKSVQAALEIRVEQVTKSLTPTSTTSSPAPTTPVLVPVRPPSPLFALLLALKPEELPDINPTNVAPIAASLSGVDNYIQPPEQPGPAPAPNRRRSARNINTPTGTSSSRATRNSSKTSLRRSPRLRQTDGATMDDAFTEISNLTDLDETYEDEPGDMSFTLTLSKKAASKARRTGLGPLERVTIGQVD